MPTDCPRGPGINCIFETPLFLINNCFELVCLHHLRVLYLDHYLYFLPKEPLEDLWGYMGGKWGKVNSASKLDEFHDI